MLRLTTLSLLLCFNSLHASSPDAWEEHQQEVQQKCLAASQLNDARVAGALVSYPDETGFDALLVSGHYPQAHMKQQPGLELCLFDRSNREAVLAEADKLLKP